MISDLPESFGVTLPDVARSAQRESNDRRLQVSLRLKAARYLAGRRDDQCRAIAMPVPDLARHELLVENGISRNRLEDLEQTRVDARPIELRVIAEALKVPPAFLLEPLEARTNGDGPDVTLEQALGLLDQMRTAMEALQRRLEERTEE